MRVVWGLAFAACILAVSTFPGPSSAKEIRLGKPQLRKLFTGNTVTLEYKGRITRQFTGRDGTVIQEFATGGRKSGSWSIAGKRNPRICYAFPASPRKCYVVLKDDLSDVIVIRKYKNKRADKLVFKVTDAERGNQLTAIAPRLAPRPAPEAPRQPEPVFTPPPPEPAPAPAMVFSRKEIRQIQFVLGKRGFDAGPVDGVMGRKTRDAIADFQQFIDQPPTGRLTESQWDKLLRGSGKYGPVPRGVKHRTKKPAPDPAPGPEPAPPATPDQPAPDQPAQDQPEENQAEKEIPKEIPKKPSISDLDSF